MEFNEKLQELRKQKNMTQEDLAEVLYVSRTAISKWESGRGYPNIDSLKRIAQFFSVTVDELLSGEEVLTIAEENNKQKENSFRDLVFGLLDISALLYLFLPLFGQKSGNVVQNVSLLSITEIAPYMKTMYLTLIAVITVWGILTLAMQNVNQRFWKSSKTIVSLLLNVGGVLLFIISPQPYAATFMFVVLIIKMAMTRKVS